MTDITLTIDDKQLNNTKLADEQLALIILPQLVNAISQARKTAT